MAASTATATSEIPTRMYIDGQWCDARDGQTLAVINPADESVVAEVAYGDAGRGRARHRRGGAGLAGLAGPVGLRPGQGPQEDRRPDARAGRRDRPHADAWSRASRSPRPRPRSCTRPTPSSGSPRKASGPTARSSRPRNIGQAALRHQAPRRRRRHDHARGTSRSRCPAARSPRPWRSAARSSAGPPSRRR